MFSFRSACLIYPRKLWIEIGNADNLFDDQYTVEAYEWVRELCKGVGTDWVRLLIFDGKHEFYRDDAPIKQLIQVLFAKEN